MRQIRSFSTTKGSSNMPSPGTLLRRLGPVLLVATLVYACGSSGSTGSSSTSYPTSHTLQLSFLQDPGQPPDPDVYYAGQGLLLTRNMYEGLVKYQSGTSNRIIVPSLATSWDISNGGLTYTFQLRSGVLFHDGTPFDSSAIEPTFLRRAAVNGGPAYMVAGVASVQTPSPSTAVINLNAPNTAFLDYLASSYGPMMESPAALAKYAGTDNDQTYLQTHDIGTGPYTLTQAKVGVSYQVQAFPQYWGTKPYYTTVNMPVIDNLSSQEIQFNSGQLAGILHDLTAPAVAQYRASSKAGPRGGERLRQRTPGISGLPDEPASTAEGRQQSGHRGGSIPESGDGAFPGHSGGPPAIELRKAEHRIQPECAECHREEAAVVTEATDGGLRLGCP
jgi:ABC-type transport system substrate-binding protein